MSQRTWLFTTVGAFVLLGGVLVLLNSLGAKPKGETGEPAARKAGPFDGDRAIAYLQSVCDIGPRISGSEGMAKQQELLQKHFEKHGAKVALQKFDGKQPSQEKAVPMANMVVSWHPDQKTRVILCGHYDTRPIADQETNKRDWTKPFASANDGTSTVAFFMELAHHMKDLKTEVGVDFVLFDAEEFIHDPTRDKFFLGSEHFASEYKRAKDGPKYKAAILLDLFAAKGAVFKAEQNSGLLAGPLLEDVWKLAAELGVKEFQPAWGYEVQDDHIALNHAGIPAIDILDFGYPHWHRLTDTPDKCSAESMATVAKVLMAWLQRTK
jgi:glutaminyl-peptide cyclotransferase